MGGPDSGQMELLSQMLVEKTSKTPLFSLHSQTKPVQERHLFPQPFFTELQTAAASGSPGLQPKPDTLARTDIVTWTHQLTQAAL